MFGCVKVCAFEAWRGKGMTRAPYDSVVCRRYVVALQKPSTKQGRSITRAVSIEVTTRRRPCVLWDVCRHEDGHKRGGDSVYWFVLQFESSVTLRYVF